MHNKVTNAIIYNTQHGLWSKSHPQEQKGMAGYTLGAGYGRLHPRGRKWQVTPSWHDMAGYTLTEKYGIWQVTHSWQNMAYVRLHTPGYSNITGATSQASEIIKY